MSENTTFILNPDALKDYFEAPGGFNQRFDEARAVGRKTYSSTQNWADQHPVQAAISKALGYCLGAAGWFGVGVGIGVIIRILAGLAIMPWCWWAIGIGAASFLLIGLLQLIAAG